MLKIALWSSFFYAPDISSEEAATHLRIAGFRYAELSDEHGARLLSLSNPLKEAKHFSEYTTELGINYFQGHLKLNANIASSDPKVRRQDIDELKKQLEVFYAAGVRRAVLHCGWNPDCPDKTFPLNVSALSELTAGLAGMGMKIALENLIEHYTTPESLLEILRAVDSEHLGICLDTSHFLLNKGDPCAFINKVGDKLIALHLSDNLGDADHHMFPCGRGILEWERFVREMKGLSYDGLFNFEVSGENLKPLEILSLKAKYLCHLAETMDKITENETYPPVSKNLSNKCETTFSRQKDI